MKLTVTIDGREALPVRAIPYVSGWNMSPYFAERDRRFRGIVTDAEMLHGYGLMLPQTVTLFVKSRSRFGEIAVTMA